MSIFSQFKMKTAVGPSHKSVFNSQHLTTSDFFKLQPIFFKEMVPGSSFKMNMSAFSRLDGLQVPTFGRCKLHLRGFFVPMQFLWRGWSDFIDDTNHVAADGNVLMHSTVPTISTGVFIDTFFSEVATTDGFATQVPDTDQYDFTVVQYYDDYTEQSRQYWKLLPLGREAYKILCSLGYQLPTSYVDRLNNPNDPVFSALPLLSFARIYLDYYRNSQYVGVEDVYNDIESLLNWDSQEPLVLRSRDVRKILMFCMFTNYDDDYFTAAWDNPTAPVSSARSNVIINDISALGQNGEDAFPSSRVDTTYSNGTPTVNSGSDSVVMNFTQFIDSALKAVSSYFNRNQLSGSRASERYKNRFGQKLSNYELRRAFYLGSKTVELQVGDVFSTADTDGAGLGDYAGRGIMADKADFSFDTDDFGYFVICASIVPEVGYYQGIDRTVMHKSKLDFWTPEYDALGTQAISKAEIYIPRRQDRFVDENPFVQYYHGIFGFTPRYAEYKVSRSQLTGDYNVRSVGLGSDSWHLFRSFEEDIPAEDIVHSPELCRGVDWIDAAVVTGSIQYDRIFSSGDNGVDHFNMFYQFNLSLISPLRPLFDNCEFDEERGREIMANLNGQQLS